MNKHVDVSLIDPARYERLQKIATEQNIPIPDLMAGRAIDLLFETLDADLPRAAATLVQSIPWDVLEKCEEIIAALLAVKATLPPKPPL